MSSGEIIFTAIMVFTAAALAGVWLSIRPPRSREEHLEAEAFIEASPAPGPRPTRPQSAAQREQTRPTSRQRPQPAQPSQAKPRAAAQPQKQQEKTEAENSVGAADGSGGPREPVRGVVLDEEMRERLEETLRLYSDLLQEMERLKKKLGEKLP